MNNFFKISVILLLILLCALILYTSVKANQTMLKVCPVNAISHQNNIAVIDSLKCINCGRCFLGIPSPYEFILFPNLKPKPAKDTQAVPKPDASVITSTDNVVSQISNTSKPDEKINPISVTGIQKNQTSGKKTTTNIKTVLKTFFKVNPDACIGCQLCVQNCPTSAITMVNGKAVIDPQKCIACGICANGNGDTFNGCPTNSISKVTEEIRGTK